MLARAGGRNMTSKESGDDESGNLLGTDSREGRCPEEVCSAPPASVEICIEMTGRVDVLLIPRALERGERGPEAHGPEFVERDKWMY